jgi:TonB family protein
MMTASLSLTALDWPSDRESRLGTMLAVSLAAHVTLFFLMSVTEWTPKARPMASQEVTLVSLPESHPPAATPVAPRVALPAAPVKATPIPPAQKEAPPVPVKTTPVTEPAPPPPALAVTPAPVRPHTLKELLGQDLPAPLPSTAKTTPRPESPMRDLMRGMELPPEAPKLDTEVPASATPAKSSKEFESSVKNLAVPKAPKVADPTPTPDSPAKTAPPSAESSLPSLKTLMTQELQKPVTTPPPAVAAKPPTVDLQKPALAIRAQSSAPGQSRYLALVQHRISQFWTPADVQATSRSLQVRLKFRLAATGAVSNVSVEKSSGVPYYDLAGERAVLSAVPLPPFPSELKEAWLDVHISFTVGEGPG